jgi:hypothetical protein
MVTRHIRRTHYEGFTVTKSYDAKMELARVCRRLVTVDFEGGEITSDAGVVLVGQVDRALGLSKALAKALPEARQKSKCEHSQLDLIRQRLYALCCGYEDLNDHQTLRFDSAIQTAVGKDKTMAGDSTLCRWENRATREHFLLMHKVMLESFIESFQAPPKELILDFDATDDATHGRQEGRFFHGYYDKYCFLPLYVFCGDQLLAAYLRPSNRDGALHAGAILRLMVNRLRQEWPEVRIVFRADSGFCRDNTLSWCERNDVDFVVGLARNPRLQGLAADLASQAEEQWRSTGEKQRLFDDIYYSTKNSWSCTRRVIAKSEHSNKGSNPRFVVTSLKGDSQEIYDTIYCARGEAENRIKEQQLYLFADRTSCHKWWPNQFRLLLSGFAYILLERLRALTLRGTKLARAQCSTIRLKLLKIGAVVIRNTRRVSLKLSSACPNQELFLEIGRRLAKL